MTVVYVIGFVSACTKLAVSKGEQMMERYECGMCEYTYDPAKGDPGRGIPPGTPFDDLPNNWTCPKCGAGKNLFVEA